MSHTIYQNSLGSLSKLFIRACCLLVLYPASGFATYPSLSLDEAISKSLQKNPQLHQYDFNKELIKSERHVSSLSPGYELSLEVEDEELTVALSSVVELGEKRRSRLAVSDAALYMHELQREVLTLDVLGDLTRHYISVLTIQEESKLAAEAVFLAKSLYSMVKRKSERGAASDIEVIRAGANLSQAKIRLSNLQQKLNRQKVKLAGFWGETNVEFGSLSGSLFSFGETQSYASLINKVNASPAMEVLASKVRLREMETKLVQSQSRADLNWQFGITQLQSEEDSALTFGVSMPLSMGARNRSRVDSSFSMREQAIAEQEQSRINLNMQLFAAYSLREQFISAAHQLESNIIPQLSSALNLTKEAYDRGRLKYQDWITAQQELLGAKQQLIEAASSALINQALIEQLTAEPLSR